MLIEDTDGSQYLTAEFKQTTGDSSRRDQCLRNNKKLF